MLKLSNPAELMRALEGVLRDDAVIGRDLRANKCAGPYLLLASDLGVKCSGTVNGMTGPRLSSTFRNEIGSRWAGYGPAAVIFDEAILGARDCFADSIPLFTAVMAHEISHCLEVPGLHSAPADGENNAIIDDFCRMQVSMPLAPLRDDELARKPHGFDAGHDAAFLRRVLHLADRLERLGWYCPLGGAWDSVQYGTASPWAYKSTLEDELEEFKAFPMVALDFIPAPAEFTAMWEADTREEFAA